MPFGERDLRLDERSRAGDHPGMRAVRLHAGRDLVITLVLMIAVLLLFMD